LLVKGESTDCRCRLEGFGEARKFLHYDEEHAYSSTALRLERQPNNSATECFELVCCHVRDPVTDCMRDRKPLYRSPTPFRGLPVIAQL
jgi:hypothetical protein